MLFVTKQKIKLRKKPLFWVVQGGLTCRRLRILKVNEMNWAILIIGFSAIMFLEASFTVQQPGTG